MRVLLVYAHSLGDSLNAEIKSAGEQGRAAAGYAKRLMALEGLVFIFPTWSMGPPAILKGFL
jgi:putative NADPH-quinone reductase